MKTMESVIKARQNQLDKYRADKQKAVTRAKDFPQTVTDSLLVEMTMPDELKAAAKDYRKTESAIELAYLPDFKDKFRKEDKSVDKVAVRTEVHRLCDIVTSSTEPLTDEVIKEVRPLFDAITKRMEKQAQNFNIQIGDAEKDILLYNLILDTKDSKTHPAGYTEFVDALLADTPKKDDGSPTAEAGMTMAELEKICAEYAKSKGKPGETWTYIGKALSKSGLKPGAGGKLVQA